MSAVQLYDRLIRATEQIVAKFGKDILTEERFVNILHDLYPDRDNPAVFRIIKSMINDGYFSELLLCDKESIQNFVSKTALALNQKNGYDKQMTEGIIYSIAVGSGVVSQNDINGQASPTPSQPKPTRQKPAIPQQKKNNSKASNTPHPKKQKQVGKTLNNRRLYVSFYLILAFFGLFISPVVYLLAIYGLWWPSFTLFLILAIQSFLFFISYHQLVKAKPLPFAGGVFSAIILCAAIFIAFAPFYADDNSTKDVFYYLGLHYEHEMAFPVITLPLGLYYLGFINIGGRIAGYDLTLIFEHMTDNYASGKTSVDKLISNKRFMFGFISTGLFVLVVGMFVMNIPTLDSWRMEVNNMLLRFDRESENKQLSFAGFRIGSELDSCINVAINHSEYNYGGIESVLKTDNNNAININNEGFSSFDSIMYVKSKWYQDSVDIKLYSIDGKVMAFLILSLYYDQDVILDLFINKYGQPEHKKHKESEIINYKGNYYNSYSWTYKNCKIQIEPGSILYYDRILESVAKQIKEKKEQEELRRKRIEQMKEEKEAERQRKQDSLNNIKRLEEEKKREYERKRAIDQI